MAVHLPRLAGEATGGSPATVSRFEPRKKVWLNLLASAGEWPLFKPAAYGWCSPVRKEGEGQSRTYTTIVIICLYLTHANVEEV